MLSSAVFAHFFLKERMHIIGVVGCVLCVAGSVAIVLYAPKEREIESVKQVWHLATQPGLCNFVSMLCIFHGVNLLAMSNFNLV